MEILHIYYFAGSETESILVDTPAPWWQVVEPKQLPYRYDPGSWRCRRHPWAYSLQGYILSNMGRSVLV